MSKEPVIPLSYQSPPLPVAQPVAAVAQGGLSAEQLKQLADARVRGARVRRAINVAKFDAYSIAIFAAFTFLGALFGSVTSAMLGIGMAVVAFVEFKGIERLKRLDPTVVKTLALNQVGLAALLLTYAIYSIATAGRDIDELKNQAPEVAQYMSSFSGLTQMISYAVYGTLAMVAIFGQGGMALYYLSRKRYIEEYASQTPQWIRDAIKAGMTL